MQLIIPCNIYTETPLLLAPLKLIFEAQGCSAISLTIGEPEMGSGARRCHRSGRHTWGHCAIHKSGPPPLSPSHRQNSGIQFIPSSQNVTFLAHKSAHTICVDNAPGKHPLFIFPSMLNDRNEISTFQLPGACRISSHSTSVNSRPFVSPHQWYAHTINGHVRVQGPVASISVREAAFLRSSSATKALRSATSAASQLRLRIPLTARGIRIVLRSPPPPVEEAHGSGSATEQGYGVPVKTFNGQTKLKGREFRGGRKNSSPKGSVKLSQWRVRFSEWCRRTISSAWQTFVRGAVWLIPALRRVPTRLAINGVLQLVLALASTIPVRIKEVEISHEVRALLWCLQLSYVGCRNESCV